MKRFGRLFILVLAIFTAFVMLPGGRAAAQSAVPKVVSAGRLHNCGLKSDGSVQCWGYNSYGQTTSQIGPFSQVSGGEHHTCGLKPDGTVQCWGYNGYGQATGQTGPFSQISAGWNHTCGLKPDGSVQCWGYNGYGQATGQTGPFSQISAGWNHTCGLKPDGSVQCWGYNGYGQTVGQTGPFNEVSVGNFHSCGLRSDGSVQCWGLSNYDQAASQTGPFSQVSAGGFHTCGLKLDGSVQCWGYNGYGQTVGQTGPFGQVSTGDYHNCGLKPDGSIQCWGRTDYGQAASQTGPFGAYAPLGSITIVKTVVGQVPGSDWSYDGDLGSFTLPAAGGQSLFDTLAADSYTINETAVSGYTQAVSCDSGETGTGSVTVELAPGEVVVCTFTNTADPGSITIVKSLVGATPSADWSYDGDLGSFTLPAAGGQSVFDTLAAGSYTVNETAVSGYSQSVSCDSGESGTGSVTVDLAPGEAVVCTFTNTADPGSITIVKSVVGATPSADWSYTGDLGSFTLPAAGGQSVFDTLAAGSFTVNETAVSGYTQAVSCDSGETGTGSVTVELAPGEDIVCTFTNTALPGSIAVFKEIVGTAPSADWAYTGDLGAFNLPAAGGDTAFSALDAGSYTLTETDIGGWVPSVSCTPGGETGTNSVTLDLALDEDAVCTFINTLCLAGTYDDGVACVPADPGYYVDTAGSSAQTACVPGYYQPAAGADSCLAADPGYYVPTAGATAQIACDPGYSSGAAAVACTPDPGSITIVKSVVGQVPSVDWSYDGDLGSFTLPAAGGQTVFDNLDADSYTVSETAVAGYSQSVSCDSGESGTGSVTVDLAPGETVVCTFTNTADPGSITVTKEIVGTGTGTFTICVDSDCKSFNGDGAQQTWSGLAPGPHTVSEQDAGPLWTEPVARTVTLLPGQSALVTVTNIYEGDVAGFCPIDENVGLHQTVLLGRGQTGRNGKLIIPNYTQVEALYGQLAAVDVGLMKYVRFTYPNKAKVQLHDPVSLAYKQAAVSWWGSELDPAKSIQGQFFWGKKGNKSPRAFVLWPAYTTTEQYADVLTLFDNSSENHVSWKLGWIPEQVQTISIPPTQAAGASVRVQIALVDLNKDERPVVVTIEAGGVSTQRVIVGPNSKHSLNVEEFMLENLPAGTDEVTITLLSPEVSSQFPLGGDSAAMIGAAVSYACALP